MTSCTIIISHYESSQFLKTCIRKIREFAHPEIEQKILIIDQSSIETHFSIFIDYAANPDVDVLHTPPLWSGYGIDYAFRNYEFKTEYICQLHADAFPIHQNWLYLPITLIEENQLSFVGQLQFIGKGTESIYPPNPFFCMAQCFNVAKTETYREMSIEAGFARFHNRDKLETNGLQIGIDDGIEPFISCEDETTGGYIKLKGIRRMTYLNDDWTKWAEETGKGGSDDDVVAFHWEDTKREHNKLGLAISAYIGPSYGRIIDDLVFHFGSCREAIGVMDKMPEKYKYYTEKIRENYSDELVEEMVESAKANKPPELEILSRNYWSGKEKRCLIIDEKLNEKIQWLKQ